MMDVTRRIQAAVVRADMLLIAAWHILRIALPAAALAVLLSALIIRRRRR